jgi:hypothetical protein
MTSHASAHGAISAARVATEVRQRPGLSWSDHLTLTAIGLVVVLVALPGLRRFALRENESDAIRMLAVLSAEAAALGEGGLGQILAPGSALERRLGDVEILPDGRVRRHGYLFDQARTSADGLVLRAWPWEHGHTGIGAFLCFDGRGVVGDANDDGRYDGPDRPPPVSSRLDARWVSLTRL